jgi:hypothetical protein
MAIVYNGRMNMPNYTCLSSDITAGKFTDVTKAAQPGMIVFASDTSEWYIVRADGVFVPYSLPVEITVTSPIDIGSVSIDQPLTDSLEIAPVYGYKQIGTPGTAEPLVGVDTYVMSFTVFPRPANSGTVYFGDADVDRTTSQQILIAKTSSGLSIEAPTGYKLNLKKFYIDVDTGTDGVNFLYFA